MGKRSKEDFLSFMDQLKQTQVRSVQANPRAGVLGCVMQGCTEMPGPQPVHTWCAVPTSDSAVPKLISPAKKMQ